MTALLALPFLSLAIVLALLMRPPNPSQRAGSIRYVRCGNCGAVLGLNGEADILAGAGRDHRCGS